MDHEIDFFYLYKSAGRRIESGQHSKTKKRVYPLVGKGLADQLNPGMHGGCILLGRNTTLLLSLVVGITRLQEMCMGVRLTTGPWWLYNVLVCICVLRNLSLPTIPSSLDSRQHFRHIKKLSTLFSFSVTVRNLNIHYGLILSNHEWVGWSL